MDDKPPLSPTPAPSPHLASLDELRERGVTRIAAAIGVFDALHVGHQQILETLRATAERLDAVPVVITFSPHPRSVLHDWEPKLICSLDHRRELMLAFGAKYTITLNFTEEFAKLPAEEFIRQCVHTQGIEVAAICVGRLWHFGAGAQGDIALLEKMSTEEGFILESVPEIIMDDEIVSTTRIRHAVTEGEMIEAEAMLNRPFSLRGTVVEGFGIAGVELEMPTANLEPESNVLPLNGVYAAYTIWKGEIHESIVAIGLAPTFHYDLSEPRVEIHLLDVENVDLINEHLEVFFIQLLRNEMEFEDPEQLKMQIISDLHAAADVFEEYEKVYPGLPRIHHFM